MTTRLSPGLLRAVLCLLFVGVGGRSRADDGATSAAAASVGLHVYPPVVRLDSARDRQRIVVQAVGDGGVTTDVTDRVDVTLSDPSLARIETLPDGGPLLLPLADGSGRLRVAFDGGTVEVPLEVRGAGTTPPLSFRLDVMPVFARGGCNMGSCHGAARGKDGFRLSLFGFDPAGDWQRVTREIPGRRVDLAAPEESLLVTKATGRVNHGGGKRFAPGDALFATLVEWIAAGAPDDPAPVADLVAVDLFPPTALLAGEGARQRMVAVARFADATDRDVTDLAWWSSNADRTAKVAESGMVESGARGEAFVMARYGSITVGVPLVVIPAELAFTFPREPGNTWIDDLVDAKLEALRVAPSAVCDDETFLRRVTIDLVGLLPTPEERGRFLADTSGDKRARLVESLMQRREFTDLWVMKWADMLQVRSSGNDVAPKGAMLYHGWLEGQVAANVPVDRMVRDLLTATGSTFENPPANYFQLERDTLKLAENVAQSFLGTRMQCAQCHNHPFDRWTMDDYYGFAAFFTGVGRKRAADPRETIIVETGSGEVKHPVTGAAVSPRFLGGAAPDLAGRSRREALAEWLTSPDNPFFARHLANLVWAHFFGRGIVHEPDDARVSNPPSNAPLLDELGRRFAASGWDFRALVRDIVASKAYQRSSEPNESNALDTTNFSHAAVRRMRAEVFLDVVAQVTATRTKFPGLPAGGRAVQVADGRTTNYFLTTFGRANREDACTCAVRMEPSLSQALHLLNGDAANDRIAQGKLVPERLAAGATPTAVIDELFVRCFGRKPDERERIETLATVLENPDPRTGLEDVFWALLNSPEFIFNH